ncbi:MAG: AMP-binding protein [Lachnospiraceae bacterium]|nr:AMP-binding protein [Lachnospiraceae bacterium]
MDYSNDHIVYDNGGNPELHADDTTTILELVRNAGKTFGDKTFLKWEQDGTVYEKSYAQTDADTERLAAWTEEQEEVYGHKLHVALLGRTGYEYLTVLLGVAASGSVAVPLDVQLSPDNLVANARKADIDILFYDWEYEPRASFLIENCENIKRIICLQRIRRRVSVPVILETPAEHELSSAPAPGDCALIIFTSGTSGVSKGVMLSHANCIDNIFCNDDLGDQYNEVALNVLPINHVFCLNGDVLTLFRYGTELAICSDLKKLFHSIEFFQPTYIRMVPMMLKAVNSHLQMAMKQEGLSREAAREKVLGKRLHKLISGGGYLSGELADSLASFDIEVGQGYGMSECSPKISVPHYGRPDKRGSVGFLVRGVQARIVDGELQVKSPSVMMGYYKDPERTKEAITEDGFLCTGDLATIDEERFVFLTGRKKNLIILSNGENISPESIEDHFDNDPIVSDILVYQDGDKIAAEVYPNYEYAQKTGITDIKSAVQELVDKHNGDLPTYSRITALSIRKDPFEKTSSKKIIRSRYFDEKSAREDKASKIKKPENETQQSLYDMLVRITGNELIGINDNLYDCGLDSMGAVLLIEEIEEKLKKIISFNDLTSHNTIASIAELLDSSSGDLGVYPPQSVYPLTNMMMYFGYVIRGNTTGNLPFTFELDPSIDLLKLKAAIEEVLNAHPGLKGIIKPAENKYLAYYRQDEAQPDIPIIKLSEAEWEEKKQDLVVPFTYTEDDRLYHIYIYETEKSKYMLFDVAHIMGDGMTMNILLEDVNKVYAGQPIEKERYTFYDYILDDKKREEMGVRAKNTHYYQGLLDGYKMSRSLLNKKGLEGLDRQDKDIIRRRLSKLTKLKIEYFCRKQGVSENVLFLTAFNYCVGLFSDEKDVMTCSIHSGRTDGRWRRLAGPLFLTYLCRQQTLPHETTLALLKRIGRQVMDTMHCQISVPREGEMFFQYQGDIIEIDRIGGLPAKRLHPRLDSLPFHMQVMSDNSGFYTELRFWSSRFDRDLLEEFLDCYEAIILSMETETSARMLKTHIPDKYIPKHIFMKAGHINKEVGFSLLEGVSEDEDVRVYVLDDGYMKKPYGAWGELYLGVKPVNCKDEIDNPYKEGVLYDTGIVARIMPNGELDLLEKSGRAVLTDGHNGRHYYNLGGVEQALMRSGRASCASSYMIYSEKTNEMELIADVEPAEESFVTGVKKYFRESCGEEMTPTVLNIKVDL